MCSSTEAFERASFKELSPFECTASTCNLSPLDRVPDPKKCVKKYRRNAAGGGVKSNYTLDDPEWKRSLTDLLLSTDYLLGTIFARQQSDGMREKESLLKTVNFIDDRLRAIQVDLTTLLGRTIAVEFEKSTLDKVREMQIKIIRYYLLARHLLSDIGAQKYEWKFSDTALTTAITCLLSTYANPCREKNGNNYLDEVLCYASLLHIAAILNKNELTLPQMSSMGKRCGLPLDDGEGFSAILGLHRKYVVNYCHKFSDCYKMFPKYTFAFKLAIAVESGDFLWVLKHLHPNDDKEVIDETEKWMILSRCCIAQAMPIVRMELLRRYNKCFGKQERVKDDELARLLRISPHAAIDFCKSIGLPTGSTIDGGHGHPDCVIMKASPISITTENISKLQNPGRSLDRFVFGERNWLHCHVVAKDVPDPYKGLSSLQRAMLKLNIQEDPNEIKIDDDDDDDGHSSNDNTRMDEDGVVIFPERIFHTLIG